MEISYKSTKQASKITGLSIYYLRNGCKNGTIPCIRSGKKFLIDMEGLAETLHKRQDASRQEG